MATQYEKGKTFSGNLYDDVSNNNLHLNAIHNKLKDVEANRKCQQLNFDNPVEEYSKAQQVDKTNFEKLRNQKVDSQRSNMGMRPSRGKEIAKTILKHTMNSNNGRIDCFESSKCLLNLIYSSKLTHVNV